MSSLGAFMTQAIVHHYGHDEFLQRLSHPFWFQSFGAVMGMDWHSSGITTSVIGTLKRGLGPLSDELGTCAAAAASIRERRRTNCMLSVNASVSMASGSPAQADWWRRSTAPLCVTVSITDSS
jgi:hypothetical protein